LDLAEGTPQGGWSFRSSAPESQQFKFEELMASDVQLMGQVTYDGFAAAWPAWRRPPASSASG
jgi:hypothetical protein